MIQKEKLQTQRSSSWKSAARRLTGLGKNCNVTKLNSGSFKSSLFCFCLLHFPLLLQSKFLQLFVYSLSGPLQYAMLPSDKGRKKFFLGSAQFLSPCQTRLWIPGVQNSLNDQSPVSYSTSRIVLLRHILLRMQWVCVSVGPSVGYGTEVFRE